MTFLDTRMTRGRRTLRLSSVLNGDISSRTLLNRINAAIAAPDIGTVVIDRSYNFTFARDATLSLLVIPSTGRRIVAEKQSVFDTPGFSNTVSTDNHRKYLFTLAGSEGSPVSMTADLVKGDDRVFINTAGLTAGMKIRLSSDKTFIEDGTKMSFASASVGLYDAVEVGQTITQGAASATVAGRYPLANSSSTFAGFVLDNIVGTFNDTTNVFQGANDLGIPTGVFNGVTLSTEKQGEIVEIYEVNSDNVRFFPPARDSYATANNATVTPLAMVGPTEFEGVAATGVGQLLDSGAQPIRGDRFIDATLANKLSLIDTRAHAFDNGIFVYSSVDGYARGNRWTTEITSDAAARNVIGYGLGLSNACQDWLVEHNTLAGWKHALVQTESGISPGVTRDIMFSNNHITQTWNFAIAAHTNADGLNTYHNVIQGCSGGIEAGCRNFKSGYNEIRGLQFVAGELGTGIAITEICEQVHSSHDRVIGGGFGLRMQDSLSPGLVSPNVGPSRIHIDNFYAESSNQCAVRLWWSGIGDRGDIQITNLQTRDIGQPVDSNGNPTAGASLAAVSLDIRGTANGSLTGVKIEGGDLRGYTGNSVASIVTQYVDGHVSNVSYTNHAAPSFPPSSNITQSNINAY